MEKNIIKNIVKKVTTSAVSNSSAEWPPTCLMFAYQPMRPISQNIQQCCKDTHEQDCPENAEC